MCTGGRINSSFNYSSHTGTSKQTQPSSRSAVHVRVKTYLEEKIKLNFLLLTLGSASLPTLPELQLRPSMLTPITAVDVSSRDLSCSQDCFTTCCFTQDSFGDYLIRVIEWNFAQKTDYLLPKPFFPGFTHKKYSLCVCQQITHISTREGG